MRIVYRQGNDAYLVALSETEALVLDVNQRRLLPPMNPHSILARGYWEPLDEPMSEAERRRIIEEVTGRPAPARVR